MKQSMIVYIFIAIILIEVRADDNNILLYNSIENCKSNEYFDVNYFVCKTCDANLYLMRAINGKLVIVFTYIDEGKGRKLN